MTEKGAQLQVKVSTEAFIKFQQHKQKVSKSHKT